MNLPTGVTQADLDRAYIASEIWQPGQRCISTQQRLRFITASTPRCSHTQFHSYPDNILTIEPHHIPPPPLTPAILYAMLEEGAKRFKFCVAMKQWWMLHKYENPDPTLATAIILAAGALK